jgi:uncharacterized membrane protein YgcG
VRGQHRYTISYVLPEALAAGPFLFLDAVGAESDIPIERVTVVVDGFELDDAVCAAGPTGASPGSGCAFERGAPLRLAVDRLEPKEGITISGEVVGRTDPAGVDPPPIPDRRQEHRQRTALLVAALGSVVAFATYRWSVRVGANEVMGTSAADAAHGPGPAASPATRTVTDADLAELAAIEFAPPRGLEPWQGRVVLTEVLDDSMVTAWFSGAIARGLVEVQADGAHPRLRRGRALEGDDPLDAHLVDEVFRVDDEVILGTYDAQFAAAWAKILGYQARWVADSGWWWSRSPAPGRLKPGGIITTGVLVVATVALVALSAFVAGLLGALGGLATALLVGLGLPALVARVAYAPLRPGRTAAGSAWALRTESFRRFLEDSEAQHVEWAWEHGLLRQYSAWAVALDAADAWQEAMERSAVPVAEAAAIQPLLVPRVSSAFTSTRTAPSTSSSGGSSSGGFSGSVGGGGGGGSHGSW